MAKNIDVRDALVEKLKEQDEYEVVDAFGGLGPSDPEIALKGPELEIEGTTFENPELLIAVSPEIRVTSVSFYDEPGSRMSETQKEVLDEVCTEKYSEDELTLWEYDPGTYEDTVSDIIDQIKQLKNSLDV